MLIDEIDFRIDFISWFQFWFWFLKNQYWYWFLRYHESVWTKLIFNYLTLLMSILLITLKKTDIWSLVTFSFLLADWSLESQSINLLLQSALSKLNTLASIMSLKRMYELDLFLKNWSSDILLQNCWSCMQIITEHCSYLRILQFIHRSSIWM